MSGFGYDLESGKYRPTSPTPLWPFLLFFALFFGGVWAAWRFVGPGTSRIGAEQRPAATGSQRVPTEQAPGRIAGPEPGPEDGGKASDQTPRAVERTVPPEALGAVRLMYEAQALSAAGDPARAIGAWGLAIGELTKVPGTELVQADCWWNLATALEELGRRREAVEALREAIALYEQFPGAVEDQAECRVQAARILMESGQLAEALDGFQRARQMYLSMAGTKERVGDCRATTSMILDALGRGLEAVEEYRAALDIYAGLVGTEGKRAECRLKLSQSLRELGRFVEALEELKAATALYARLPQMESERATCHADAGALLVGLGRYAQGIDELRAGLALYAGVPGTGVGRANAHQNLAVALVRLGQPSAAIEELRAALRICSTLPDSEGLQGDCHNKIGIALRQLHQFEDAIAEFQVARDLLRKSPETEAKQAACVGNIGRALLDLHRYDEALAMTHAALETLPPGPETAADRAALYVNRGVVLARTGAFEAALGDQKLALEIYSRLRGQERGQAKCLVNIGVNLIELAQPESAVDELKKALTILAALPGTEREQAACRLDLGAGLCALGRHSEGIEEIRRALGIFQNLPNAHEDVGLCHNALGVALIALGRHDEALRELQSALSLYQGHQVDVMHQVICLGNKARALVALGRPREALAETQAARDLGFGTWMLDEARAAALEALGDPESLQEALTCRYQSLVALEIERMFTFAPEHQMSAFEDKAITYEGLASLVLRLPREGVPLKEPEGYTATMTLIGVDGKSWEAPAWQAGLLSWGDTPAEIALHFADRGKARALLGMVLARPVHVDDPAFALVAERRQLQDEIHALLKHRGPALPEQPRDEIADLTRQIKQKQARQWEIDAELQRTATGPLLEPELLRPAEFSRTLAAEEACLEYVVREQELLLFLVSVRGIRGYRFSLARDAPPELCESGKPSIPKLVAAYRQAPDKPGDLGLEGLVWLQREWMDCWRDRTLTEAEHVAVSQALGRMLLPTGLRQTLADERVAHLLIVPSRFLGFVSFSTLITGPRQGTAVPTCLVDSRFLAEDYSVSYVQSLALLRPIRERTLSRIRGDAEPYQFLALVDPIHDDSDPRAGHTASRVQLSEAELERAGVDEVLRGLVRSVAGITPPKQDQARWHRLPETRREAEAAAGQFGAWKVHEEALVCVPGTSSPGVICAGYAANRPLATSGAASRYRHLLFGVHGHTDMANAWLSALMLTDLAAEPGTRQPAPLTMSDIFGMSLNAETVVLAACQTAMGRMRAGEGVVGFQLAFLSAGADTVVLTQWEVPSAIRGEGGQEVYPTTEVVAGFYRNLRSGGMNRAQALRQAQLALLRRGGQFADPFCWGAWQLFGEWR